MEKRICDKCGKDCTGKHEYFRVGGMLTPYIGKDLCKSCDNKIMKIIKNWFKGELK